MSWTQRATRAGHDRRSAQNKSLLAIVFLTMDIFGILLDQVCKYHGWRFYVPLFVAACVAITIYFTVGFVEPWASVALVVALVCVLTGIGWQYIHEKHDA